VREQDDEVQVPQSPGSRELANYNEYLRRVTPQYVRSALEAVVNSEIQPLEERLRELLPGLIVEAQGRAFSSYQAMTSANRDTESNPLDDGNQPTSLVTFYQPPQPQVQTEQYSDFQVPHHNAEKRDASDSSFPSEPSRSGFCESTTLDSASSNTTVTSDVCAHSKANNMPIAIPDLPQMASRAVSGEIHVDPNQAQWLPSFQEEQLGEESTPSLDYPASYNENYDGNGSSQGYGLIHEPTLFDECYISQEDSNVLDSMNLDDLVVGDFNF
jgi:hypothetical protein